MFNYKISLLDELTAIGPTTPNHLPEKIALLQNYPNPFNPVTIIPFRITDKSQVKLVIYDILGKRVYTLLNRMLTAGNYEAPFDASNFSSGIYYYQLQTDTERKTKKLIFIK